MTLLSFALMQKIDFSPIVRNTCGGFMCVCLEPFTYSCYYYKTCNKFGVSIMLHFPSLLNVGLPIVRAVKTLSSCEDVNYKCFEMVRCNFHNLASILINVRQKTLLFVWIVGVNHVAEDNMQLGKCAISNNANGRTWVGELAQVSRKGI